MGISGWISLVMGLIVVAVIAWFTVYGWFRYPAERGKGSIPGNNNLGDGGSHYL